FTCCNTQATLEVKDRAKNADRCTFQAPRLPSREVSISLSSTLTPTKWETPLSSEAYTSTVSKLSSIKTSARRTSPSNLV
ncbi:hypothetical protein BgiBS90_029129, partial [Biomphalaria glabrata]